MYVRTLCTCANSVKLFWLPLATQHTFIYHHATNIYALKIYWYNQCVYYMFGVWLYVYDRGRENVFFLYTISKPISILFPFCCDRQTTSMMFFFVFSIFILHLLKCVFTIKFNTEKKLFFYYSMMHFFFVVLVFYSNISIIYCKHKLMYIQRNVQVINLIIFEIIC